jgi:hypothetical protein
MPLEMAIHGPDVFMLALCTLQNITEGWRTFVDRAIDRLKVGDLVIVLGGEFEGLCGTIFDLVTVGSRIQYSVSMENGEYAVYQRSELALLESSPTDK